MLYKFLGIMLVSSLGLHAMQSPITRQSFKPQTIIVWTILMDGLLSAAPERKIDISKGLSAIIADIHRTQVQMIVNDEKILKRANEILIQTPRMLAEIPAAKLTHEEQTKLGLTAILQVNLKAKYQQEFKLLPQNTQEKNMSAGEKALQDNLELMALNSHLDATKCDIEVKAFLTAYFYLRQQSSSN